VHRHDPSDFSEREFAARLALPYKLQHGLRSGSFGDVRRHPDVAVGPGLETDDEQNLPVVGLARFRELTHRATLQLSLSERDRLASDRTPSQNSATVLLTISTYASKVPIGEAPNHSAVVAAAAKDPVGAFDEKRAHHADRSLTIHVTAAPRP